MAFSRSENKRVTSTGFWTNAGAGSSEPPWPQYAPALSDQGPYHSPPRGRMDELAFGSKLVATLVHARPLRPRRQRGWNSAQVQTKQEIATRIPCERNAAEIVRH